MCLKGSLPEKLKSKLVIGSSPDFTNMAIVSKCDLPFRISSRYLNSGNREARIGNTAVVKNRFSVKTLLLLEFLRYTLKIFSMEQQLTEGLLVGFFDFHSPIFFLKFFPNFLSDDLSIKF